MQSNEKTIQEAIRLAQTPAGKELAAMLQRQGGANLQQAMDKAARGDYSQVQQALATLLQSDEAKDLLKKMGR